MDTGAVSGVGASLALGRELWQVGAMKKARIPLGVSEFREIRERSLAYVDKSLLIRELAQDEAKVILLPRPRRFGKTTNLSMLRAYFEKTDTSLAPLFSGLAISQEAEEIQQHQGHYPVIALTFKDVKARTWERCREAMAGVLAGVYREHRALLRAGILSPGEVAEYQAIELSRASDTQLWGALRHLSEWLHRLHGEQVLVLLDEYDTPIHASYVCNYYDDAVEFFRNFLSGGLKDNRSLWKGVVTGVLRVARDSVLTGLNNLEVYSLLRPEYNSYFGFTEPEVAALAELAGAADRLDDIRRWYNGYVFGGAVVYNPWSVLAYLKSEDKELRAHWAETSSNDLIQELLVGQGLGFRQDMEALVRGEQIERPVAEHVALREAREREDLLWSLLLFTGYLKVVGTRRHERVLYATLAVPNQEVLSIYETLFLAWASKGLGGDDRRLDLVRALLQGDADTSGRLLQRWMLSSVSFYDTAAVDPPERFYHGFVLGLLVSLGSRYEVSSNAESGYGRCDVMVVPRQAGQPGVVLELKVRDTERGETVEEALARALSQLRDRDYAAGLRARGAHPVHELALVFDGKRVHSARSHVP